MINRIAIFFALLLFSFNTFAQNVFFNEVSYHADASPRGIEIANPDLTDLFGWKVILYNSDGNVDTVIPLSGNDENTPGPSDMDAADFIWVDVVVMMNEPNFGVGLVNGAGNVVQFISFEEEIWATEGAAAGYPSTPIGGQADAANSLQLVGTGYSYSDFDWAVPGGSTPSEVNTNQTFEAPSSFFDLPVEWLNFSATPQQRGILLEWTTATELDNQHFIIEKSYNGQDFEVVEYIESQGSSTAPQSYQFLDQKAQRGVNYYRLSQEDFNGKVDIYKVINAVFETSTTVSVFPNPAVNDITISLPVVSDDVDIRIFDVQGQLVLQQRVDAGNGVINLNVTDLPKGYYTIHMNVEGQLFSEVLLKQ